jgi:predicted DNA-binding WGR domain protein
MSKCTVHSDFFDNNCAECKREYADLKGRNDINQLPKKEGRRTSKVKSKYKEFTEERAKKLYEDLILQYVNKGIGEVEAAERARTIIRKQCMMRGIKVWPWVE